MSTITSNIIVKKFGGTSVGTIERIEAVADRLVKDISRGEKPVVVVSAMSGETNKLVALGNQIDKHYRGPAYDLLVSSGEQVSVALLSIALEKRGIRTKSLLGYQLGIKTDSVHAKARILEIDKNILTEQTSKNIVPVIAGFQGVTEDGDITTLGRGGSDTSAVAVAAALGAADCEIYTDVPAVFTADPRLVPKAKELSKISFEEMMEMASLGSKVLHIRSVEIAAKYNIKIHVRSTFESRDGTWIVPESEIMENPLVSSVTHEDSIVIFQLFPTPSETSFLSDLFQALAKKGVVVDIITQSQQNEGQRLAFSVSQEDIPMTEVVLKELPQAKGISINKIENVSKISIVGVGMRNHPGVAASFFKILADNNVKIHLITTSEIKVSAVIPKDKLSTAAQSLHSFFKLDN